MFCAPNSIFSSGPDKRRLEEKIVGSFNACRLDNYGKKITKKIRFFGFSPGEGFTQFW
jgi:hypothetical protein